MASHHRPTAAPKPIVRQSQNAFIARGLASAARVAAGLERTYPADEVFERLKGLIERKKRDHLARQAAESDNATHR